MKRLLILICLLICTPHLHSQVFFIDLEDTLTLKHVMIDSGSAGGARWHITQPNKTLFNSAYSAPNAIMTDTAQSYPKNDTLVFFINFDLLSFGWPSLSFYYQMDSDSAKDFGRIAASPDSGATWIDLFRKGYDPADPYGISWTAQDSNHNTTYSMFKRDSTPFTGTFNGWNYFYCGTWNWMNIFPNSTNILYKLSFISDSIETFQEGWLIDDIGFTNISSGIADHTPQASGFLYPNPASTYLIVSGLDKGTILLYNLVGQLVLKEEFMPGASIDIRHLPRGSYSYILQDHQASRLPKKLQLSYGKVLLK